MNVLFLSWLDDRNNTHLVLWTLNCFVSSRLLHTMVLRFSFRSYDGFSGWFSEVILDESMDDLVYPSIKICSHLNMYFSECPQELENPFYNCIIIILFLILLDLSNLPHYCHLLLHTGPMRQAAWKWLDSRSKDKFAHEADSNTTYGQIVPHA